jgi:hypothetical protein
MIIVSGYSGSPAISQALMMLLVSSSFGPETTVSPGSIELRAFDSDVGNLIGWAPGQTQPYYRRQRNGKPSRF